MAYEIDFLGSNLAEKDYDAIAFRYLNSEGRMIVCVFDGGTLDVGEEMCEHLKKYYLNSTNAVDYVFCSHPDLDHAAGLKPILDKILVRNLVVNFPWNFIDPLFDMVKDGRITKESLERTLREKYPFVDELEKLALKKNINIIPGFPGANLPKEMKILSPTPDFYLECLANSDKTPSTYNNFEPSYISADKSDGKNVTKAIWGKDAIREGEKTSLENEASIILKVKTDDDAPFLLLGDVGCEGLKRAMDLADWLGNPLNECAFIQIPHHGGRHNVSPSILNRLIGDMVTKDAQAKKTAFVSVGKNSDHPRKSVVNAFINRGCKVFVSRSNTISHFTTNMPKRGWEAVKPEAFSDFVEPWEN